MDRGQGAFEYILMLGGTLLVVAVVILAIRGQLGGIGGNVNQSVAISKPITCAPTDTGITSPGLVASWHFEESGATALDSSGNANTGTDTATTAVQGRYGNARYFNGNAFVSVPSSPTLQVNESMTIEFWIKPENAGGGRINPVDKQYAREFAITIEVVRGANLFYGDDLNPPNNYRSVYPFPNGAFQNDGKWTHYAVTRDASTKTMKSYINGALSQTITYTLTGSTPKGNNPVLIGRGYTNFGLVGAIDEVKIYGRALTQAEIRADMNCAPV